MEVAYIQIKKRQKSGAFKIIVNIQILSER